MCHHHFAVSPKRPRAQYAACITTSCSPGHDAFLALALPSVHFTVSWFNYIARCLVIKLLRCFEKKCKLLESVDVAEVSPEVNVCHRQLRL